MTRAPQIGSQSVPAVPRDELGLDPYIPKYPDGDRSLRSNHIITSSASSPRLDSVVPWDLRDLDRHQSCGSLHFVSSMAFWKCVERAVRVAIVGVLPAAVLLHATFDSGHGPWKSQSLLVVGALLAILGKETIGLQVAYLGMFLRSSLVWVSIVTAATALQLYDHMAACFVVYGVCLFVMATLMEGYTRRLAMLFLTITTMDMLRTQRGDGSERRYFDLWVELLIGTGFAFVGSLVPWPALSSNAADECLDGIASNISTALQGLAASFWTDTNLTRNVRMVRVRFIMHSIETHFCVAKQHLVGAEHEWMLQSAERRSLRLLKMDLYVKLFRNLSSIRRVVEIVRDRPSILSHSERAVLFGERLGKRMDSICFAVDELLFHLNRAQNHDELLNTGIFFDNVDKLHSELQDEFHAARREYFYETRIDTVEEFVPLMTFYVFSMSQICVTLTRIKEIARRKVREREKVKSRIWTRVQRFMSYMLEYFSSPLFGSITHFKHLFIRRNPNDVRYAIEAVKVSLAMVASLVFYYYTDENYAFLSGPTVIAFIASQNPAEAVISSIPRLSGTLMGVVLGFFIANNAENSESRIAGLVTLVFVARVVTDVKHIGSSLMYAGFISISQLSVVPLSQEATMSRIQQSTFAVFIYVIITLFVFPCRPTTLLREARSDAILRIARVYEAIMETFIETGEVYAAAAAGGCATTTKTQHALRANEPDALDATTTTSGGLSFASSFLAYPKEKFDCIDQQLIEVDKFLLDAQGLMSFVTDEPHLSLTPYPTRSCQDAQAALKKIVALLRTMSESMRLMRERHLPASKEMIGLLRNVVPCAKDTTFELHRFSLLVASLILERRLDLGTELTKSSQAFSHMCTTFHRRKSVIFLQVIQSAVNAAVPAADSDNRRTGGCLQAQPTMTQRQQFSLHDLPISSTPRCDHTAVPHRSRVVGEASMDNLAAAADEAGPEQPTAHDPAASASRVQTAQPQSSLRGSSSVPTPQSTHHLNETVDDAEYEEREDDTKLEDASYVSGSVLDSKVKLPPSYQIPITTQDAESLHTLTFSIVLLASELRKLLVSVEDSLQHRNR